MKVTIIAAIGKNQELGKDNNLLWHLPADMQFFKQSTYWHHIIMGRKNYESIPAKYRPLADRTNIVISRNPDFNAPECFVVTSLEEALEIARDYEEENAFVIGGAQIYKLALEQDIVDEMLISHVDGEFPQADTFFPGWDASEWETENIMEYNRDLSNPFSFKVVKYSKKGRPVPEAIDTDKKNEEREAPENP